MILRTIFLKQYYAEAGGNVIVRQASRFGSSSKGIVVRFQMAFGAILRALQQAEMPTELAAKRFGIIAEALVP